MHWILFTFSLIVSLLLELSSSQTIFSWFKPDWILLVLLYWIVFSTIRLGLLSTWVLGLSMDFLMGSPIGHYALTFISIHYINSLIRPKLDLLLPIQFGFTMLSYIVVATCAIYTVNYFTNISMNNQAYFTFIVTNMILSPLVYLVLKYYDKKINY